MPRARSNSLFGKKVTYHRDVAAERKELRSREKLRRAEEAAELRRLAIEEKKRKAERRAADAVDRQIEREWREKGYRNPAVSAEQYRLAQAVLSGTARETSMSKKAAREIVDRTPAKIRSLYSKRNPLDSAAALSEAWHGRAAETETDYLEAVRFHGVLTDLGRLVEFKVWVSKRHTRAIGFDQATRLASNEDGEQLYVVGGDQSLDLGAFGIVGHAAAKDLVAVGPVYSVTYHTAKHHLGKADKTPGPYEHIFCEHKQEEPTLVYDTMNHTVGLAGGEYHIDVDIDGKYSAGIRD